MTFTKPGERRFNLAASFLAVQSGQKPPDCGIALFGGADFLRGVFAVSLIQYHIAEVDGIKAGPQLHFQELISALLRLRVQFRQTRRIMKLPARQGGRPAGKEISPLNFSKTGFPFGFRVA